MLYSVILVRSKEIRVFGGGICLLKVFFWFSFFLVFGLIGWIFFCGWWLWWWC